MKNIVAVILLIAICFSFTACSGESKLTGSWAYNYDEKTEVLYLGKNSKARYHGTDYTYSYDESFINLTSQDGEEFKIRYLLSDDFFLIYETTDYESKDGHDGLVGNWLNYDKKWSFEFTKDGEFIEDGYFTGSYTVNDEGNSFTLNYNDDFNETVCYFSIEGETLSVEYPWLMEKTATK